MRVVLAVLALLCAAPAIAADDEPALPGWMAGCWESRDGENWAEECWTIPRAGMMLGSGRSGAGGELRSWEAMRIALAEPNGEGPTIRMAFAASPGGQGWTIFAWSPPEDDEEGVTFYNAANDYPQRVHYWIAEDRLNAEISLLDGSQAMRWTFRRMGQ